MLEVLEQWELEVDGEIDPEGQTVRESKVVVICFYYKQNLEGFFCFYTSTRSQDKAR